MDRCKKKRLHQESEKVTEIDRIGELPDSLLIYILSLLGNMKEAVKTDLLSKRWLNLWTNLDTLVFRSDIENPTQRNLNWFMISVDKILMKCTRPKIKKFSVTGLGFNRVNSHVMVQLVHNWIDFLFEKNVEELTLGLKGLEYEIPDSFFRNSSFVTLEIDNMGRRDYPDYTWLTDECASLVSLERDIKTFGVSWNKLKCLLLKCVYVEKEFLADILLGCPVLETMILDAVRGLNAIDINSPSLRELKVINFAHNTENIFTLDISAPWVEKLELLGCFDEIECQLVNVSSLKSARLTLNYTDNLECWMSEDESGEDEERYGHPKNLWLHIFNGLLKPVCNVDELVIGAQLLKALSMSKLSHGDSLIFNCKRVTLQSPICIHEVPGIVALLESSPSLETLVINMMPLQSHEIDVISYNYLMEKVFTSFDGFRFLSEQKKTFPCLKNVTVDCSGKPCCGEIESSKNKCFCFEHKVVTHIIRNSPVLEQMEVSADCSDCATRYMQLVSCLPDMKLEINLQDGASR